MDKIKEIVNLWKKYFLFSFNLADTAKTYESSTIHNLLKSERKDKISDDLIFYVIMENLYFVRFNLMRQ